MQTDWSCFRVCGRRAMFILCFSLLILEVRSKRSRSLSTNEALSKATSEMRMAVAHPHHSSDGCTVSCLLNWLNVDCFWSETRDFYLHPKISDLKESRTSICLVFPSFFTFDSPPVIPPSTFLLKLKNQPTHIVLFSNALKTQFRF